MVFQQLPWTEFWQNVILWLLEHLILYQIFNVKHHKKITHKMNKIHERFLCLLLKNYKGDFQDLLKSSGDVSIRQRCINSLLTDVYKYIYELCNRANIYNTRQFNVFETFIAPSNRYGLNLILHKANQLWNWKPRKSCSLALFKNEIKLWEFFNCPYNICKSYVLNLEYCVLSN